MYSTVPDWVCLPWQLNLDEGTKFPIWTPSEPTQHPPRQRLVPSVYSRPLPPPRLSLPTQLTPPRILHAPSSSSPSPPRSLPCLAPHRMSSRCSVQLQLQSCLQVHSSERPRATRHPQPSDGNQAGMDICVGSVWLLFYVLFCWNLRLFTTSRPLPNLSTGLLTSLPHLRLASASRGRRARSEGRRGEGMPGEKVNTRPDQARPDHEFTEHSTTTITAPPPLITIGAR